MLEAAAAQGAHELRSSQQACLPSIALRHSEAVKVLSALGFQGKASKKTFYEYIKSLRKIGTPFPGGSIGHGRRVLARYSYDHLMELALILTLRVYHVVPDALIVEVIRHRRILLGHYRRAYLERKTKLGRPVTITFADRDNVHLAGTYLDLSIDFSGGLLTRFGPPRLIGPVEAAKIYISHDQIVRSLLPIPLSRLAERLVKQALKHQGTDRFPPAAADQRRSRSKTASR